MVISKSQILLTKKIVSIIQNQEDINFQSERTTFFKSDGLTLASPIRDHESYYFSRKYMLREKTSAIRYNKNYNHKFEFMRCRACGSIGVDKNNRSC